MHNLMYMQFLEKSRRPCSESRFVVPSQDQCAVMINISLWEFVNNECTVHVAGLYEVGVGVSLIGRMRWTAAATEGREERDSISLPTSECPYPSCGSHATARARTHARSHSHAPPPPPSHNPHSHAVVFCLLRGELPSFLPFRARRRMHILVFRALPGSSMLDLCLSGRALIGGDDE